MSDQLPRTDASRDPGPPLDALVAWAEATPSVRAVILTSSRAVPGAPIDEFSDHDVILAVTEPDRYAGDLEWQSVVGAPLVRWGDEAEVLGQRTSFRGVVTRDLAKVDFTIWPLALLDAIGAEDRLPDVLDHGYRVLHDPDGGTRGWPQPTRIAYVLGPPSEAEYRAQVEEFWWDMSYVPKALARGDLFFAASFMLEHDLKHVSLRRMLEWRIAAARGWTFAPGPHGRRLDGHLDPETSRELAATYVGSPLTADAIWAAVDRVATLYRRVASDVAGTLGYRYPQDIDDRMSAHLGAVRHGSR